MSKNVQKEANRIGIYNMRAIGFKNTIK
jgi:hypothetical protein